MAPRAEPPPPEWDYHRAFRWSIITPLWFDVGLVALAFLGPRVPPAALPFALVLGVFWLAVLATFGQITLRAIYGDC